MSKEDTAGSMGFSVITPSLNQGKFIEKNIQSVLAQNYPNVEHIVIDGGSSDETIDVLKRYPHLRWISEPDRGQAHALNKGLRMSRGEIIGWLNADDEYLPGTFERVARALDKSGGRWVVMGDVQKTDESGRVLRVLRNDPKKFHHLVRFWDPNRRTFHQPGVFFYKEILTEVGFLDESLHFAMDYDLWLRIIQIYDFYRIDAIFAKYRFHETSKSNLGWDAFMPEWELVSKRYVERLSRRQKTCYSLCLGAFKRHFGKWLPRSLRRVMGLPKIRSRLKAGR